jgi:DNA anti-recombination protein RmuC
METFLIGLLAILALTFLVLLAFLWRLRTSVSSLREQISNPQALGELGAIRNQLQSLPVALGDLGAVKSQVETINRTVQQIEAIKSQVETLAGATESIGGIQSQVKTINAAVQQIEAIKSQVETLSGATETIGGIKSQVDSITQTVQQLHALRSDLEQVKTREAQLNEVVSRIASKLIGTRDIGAAGENILSEAFACFPPGWIETDFRVGGKVVEFALVLPNQKRLPIDSKFPAAGFLERLGEETDALRRQEIVKQIESAIYSKAQEAAKYIDPMRTIPLAVAAVPDAAYGVCRKAHFDAIRSDVLVISYSMALPVLLALYRFQLQFATSIDQQNLENYLRNIESALKVMEEQFENRIKEAGTRIGNAYAECTQQIAKIRGSLSALRTPAIPVGEPQQALDLDRPYLLEKTEA